MCAQECRDKKNLKRFHKDWIIVQSASQAGAKGRRVMINGLIKLLTKDGKRRPIKKQHVQPVHYDPTRVIVRIATPSLTCTVASFHAPHNDRPPVEVTQWWEQTDKLLSMIKHEAPICSLTGMQHFAQGSLSWPTGIT